MSNNPPNVKRRKLQDKLIEILSQINDRDTLEIGNKLFNALSSRSSNHPVTEGVYTGPITTWIEHNDIDESNITLTDIAGGDVRLVFQERVWNSWRTVNPDGQAASPGGNISEYREVDSGVYAGDHQLKVECNQSTTYHLKFESRDR